MKECDLIRNRLPAYLEDALSTEEKRSIEGHIASCDRCKESMADLKKTQELLHGLEKVEPPPWFSQKVMKRVREEAREKKGFFRRFFYPLHIKIPAEVLATCLVAILVIYVYRVTGPEKQILRPREETVAVKTEDTDRADSAVKAVGKKKDLSSLDLEKEKPAAVPHKPTPNKAETEVDRQDRELVFKGPQAENQAQPPAALAPEKKQKVLSASKMQEKTQDSARVSTEDAPPALLSLPPQSTLITIHVRDAAIAAQEAEKLLGRFKAKDVIKTMGEKPVFAALIPAGNMGAFLTALKPLGEVKEQRSRDRGAKGSGEGVTFPKGEQAKTPEIAAEDVSIRLEIIPSP